MNGSNGAAATAPVTPEVVSVLLVEDNPGDARLIRDMIAEHPDAPFNVSTVERLAQGLERLSAGETGLVLLDLSLPDSLGLDTFSTCTWSPRASRPTPRCAF